MAETIKNQDALHIPKPQPGQSSVLAVDPGTTIYLDFPLDQAEVVFQGGDLIFRFENGEQVELDNFEEVLSSTNLFLADGTEVSGDQIMDTLQPGAGEPAAGAAPPSGGAGEYNDYLGDSPDGIDRLGTLGPREFGFTPEEPNAEGVNFATLEALPDEESFLVECTYDERGGDIRFYDIDATGNVLANDSPDGVSVTSFSVDGSVYDPGTTVTLPSGAEFTLSANGTWEYDLHNIEMISDPDIVTDEDKKIESGEILTIDDIGTGFEYAEISFTEDSINLFGDDFTIRYWDGDADPNGIYTADYTLHGYNIIHDFSWDIYDEQGITKIEIEGQNGEIVFDTLKVVDIDGVDMNLSEEVVNYTIADAIGNTDSSTLTLSFIAIGQEQLNPTPVPETVT